MDDWERRKFIALQATLLILDFPALICSLILLISWRSKSFVQKIKAVTYLALP
jgi:hypothetical protein